MSEEKIDGNSLLTSYGNEFEKLSELLHDLCTIRQSHHVLQWLREIDINQHSTHTLLAVIAGTHFCLNETAEYKNFSDQVMSRLSTRPWYSKEVLVWESYQFDNKGKHQCPSPP